MTELSPDDHAELLSKLTALRQLAQDLAGAFDDSRAEEGAQEMLASIDRMLELVGGSPPPE